MCHKVLILLIFVTDERLLARELCLSHYGILFPICKFLYYCLACMIFVSSLTVAFPRCAMRYVQKNEGLMTRELCDCRTVV